ncbi:MAG: sigma 54-interacting transcriptional regulator, partial [Halioglobus sp.]|nr:sigma 54-interacting transcriptional regulator [Halioglobus sp.]
TGAAKQTPGKIEYADKGTLFLDEIGDLPMELQSKLLRFLQERVVERIGGRKEIPVDVRIVCATHQDLQNLIENGLFREDLFYRISELVLEIPPLKDREGDVLLLAKSFLKVWGAQYKSSATGFSQDAIHAIESHDWPGNVRELESRVKRAAIMADSNQIVVEDLELNETENEPLPLNLRAVREEAERRAVLRALNHSDQNISDAAISLGVTRPTLYNLMEKLGLKV